MNQENGKSLDEHRSEWRRELQRSYLGNTAHILDALEERFGAEVADVVERAVAEQTALEVAAIVEAKGSNTLDDLMETLWGPEAEKTHRFSIERRDDGIHVTCTSCPIAELGRELGLSKWMYHLDCSKDRMIARTFNPRLRCQVVKVLTKGDDCCYQIYSEER